MFAALSGFVELQRMQFMGAIDNAYQWRRELFTDVVATFIRSFIPDKEHLNPQFRAVVNA
jgi:hypothetical protein